MTYAGGGYSGGNGGSFASNGPGAGGSSFDSGAIRSCSPRPMPATARSSSPRSPQTGRRPASRSLAASPCSLPSSPHLVHSARGSRGGGNRRRTGPRLTGLGMHERPTRSRQADQLTLVQPPMAGALSPKARLMACSEITGSPSAPPRSATCRPRRSCPPWPTDRAETLGGSLPRRHGAVGYAAVKHTPEQPLEPPRGFARHLLLPLDGQKLRFTNVVQATHEEPFQ